jgi:hypothetical protein
MGLKIISGSDFHLNVPRIAVDVIADNIRKVLFPRLRQGDVSLFVYPGDFFDGLMEFGGRGSYVALCLLDDLIDLSLEYGFYIRFLQGTFTHDRHQTRMFNLRTAKVPLLEGHPRIKFYDVMDIEQLKPLGLNLLYKPDDLPYKDAFKRMTALVQDTGIAIDLLVNHGYFKHLLPYGIPHEPINTLDATAVGKLIQGVTLNGHIHTPSVHKRVINIGSFDRLAHGEEEAKGFFELDYDPLTKKCTHHFIENTYATLFKTIDITAHEQDIEACKRYVSSVVTPLMEQRVSTSKDVFIRLASKTTEARQALATYVMKAFENVVVSTKSIDDLQPKLETLEVCSEPLEALPVITPNNLAEMIVEFSLANKTPLTLEYVNTTLAIAC